MLDDLIRVIIPDCERYLGLHIVGFNAWYGLRGYEKIEIGIAESEIASPLDYAILRAIVARYTRAQGVIIIGIDVHGSFTWTIRRTTITLLLTYYPPQGVRPISLYGPRYTELCLT